MPKCQDCKYEWAWWDTVKIGFKNNKKCLNCHKRQYVTSNVKRSHVLYYLVPGIVLLICKPLLNLSASVFLSIAFLFVIIMIVTIPYTIKLSNEEEPLVK